MKATSNAVEELAKGREPKEMSRPSTTTRSGFMESQGAGNFFFPLIFQSFSNN